MASHPFEISTDRGQTAVERSLAEIRAGRPVLVQGQGEAVLVASAESLEPELCQRLPPPARGRPRPPRPGPRPPPPPRPGPPARGPWRPPGCPPRPPPPPP